MSNRVKKTRQNKPVVLTDGLIAVLISVLLARVQVNGLVAGQLKQTAYNLSDRGQRFMIPSSSKEIHII